MSDLFLGVDTSNYTTSVSCVSTEGIVFERRTMLSVPLGERGLRQSDAVFQHVRNLPKLIEPMLQAIDRANIRAVAVSAKPTSTGRRRELACSTAYSSAGFHSARCDCCIQ